MPRLEGAYRARLKMPALYASHRPARGRGCWAVRRRASRDAASGAIRAVQSLAGRRSGGLGMTTEAKQEAVRGVCTVCGCTDQEACAEGCEWTNRQHTLCSVCYYLEPEDRAARRSEAIDELWTRIDGLESEVVELM